MNYGDRYTIRQTAIVVLCGLILAFLLNVNGVYKWAKNLPHSDFREIALAALDPFNEIYLDSGFAVPRVALSEWLASNRVTFRPTNLQPLAVDTLALVGPQAPKPKLSDPPKPKLKVPRSENILIMGDSMMVGALGKVMVSELEKTSYTPYRRARISTGLARPDYFNWEKEVVRIYQSRNFSQAFVMLGGNDTQDIKSGNRKYSLGSKSWAKIYAKRAKRLVDFMCKHTASVVWLGSPPMRSTSYNRKIQFVNNVLKTNLKGYSCVTFVSTGHLFVDQTGKYTSYQKVFGQFRKVRMSDGIHLTRSGGHLLAQHLFEATNLLESR